MWCGVCAAQEACPALRPWGNRTRQNSGSGAFRAGQASRSAPPRHGLPCRARWAAPPALALHDAVPRLEKLNAWTASAPGVLRGKVSSQERMTTAPRGEGAADSCGAAKRVSCATPPALPLSTITRCLTALRPRRYRVAEDAFQTKDALHARCSVSRALPRFAWHGDSYLGLRGSGVLSGAKGAAPGILTRPVAQGAQRRASLPSRAHPAPHDSLSPRPKGQRPAQRNRARSAPASTAPAPRLVS